MRKYVRVATEGREGDREMVEGACGRAEGAGLLHEQ